MLARTIRSYKDIRISFKTKFIAGLSVIILLSFLFSGFLSYRLHLRTFEREVGGQFSQTVDQVLARIDLRAESIFRLSNEVMLNPFVQSYIGERNAGGDGRFAGYTAFNQFLNQSLQNTSHLLSVVLHDLREAEYRPTNAAVFTPLSGEAMSRIDEALASTDGELIWLRLPFSMVSGQADSAKKIVVAARWAKNERLETYGKLIILLNDSFFSNDLNEVPQGNDGRLYLISKEGSLLYTNAGPEEPAAPPPGQSGVVRMDERWRLLAHSESLRTGFRLTSHISMSDIRSNSQTILRTALLTGLGSAVLSGLLSALLSHRITQPLRQLMVGMRRVREGRFDTKIRVRTRDELNDIGESFNAMTERINYLVSQVYEKQLLQKETELAALQAQINPHFLYNSLDMLYWRLYLQEDMDNARLVVSLSSILRYALEPSSTETTLEEELEQVKMYLNIQQARFEEGLELDIDVDDSVLRCGIIRLLLQPLVENAFVHGFKDKAGMKRLAIRAFPEGDKLRIDVEDNGCGMDAGLIGRLRAETGRDGGETTGRGIGLRSVIRRISLYYGEPYGLRAESDGGGTRFELTLPLNDARANKAEGGERA